MDLLRLRLLITLVRDVTRLLLDGRVRILDESLVGLLRVGLGLCCDEFFSSPGQYLLNLELQTVRSPLYRCRFSRSNTPRAAHDEIYKFQILLVT